MRSNTAIDAGIIGHIVSVRVMQSNSNREVHVAVRSTASFLIGCVPVCDGEPGVDFFFGYGFADRAMFLG